MDGRSGQRKANPRRPLDLRAVSPFVGRNEELRRLSDALTLAAEGQGGTIFLTGQSGIGKTRLAREALALARGRGFIALEGRAIPLGLGLAYAPFLDALGPLLHGLDPDRVSILVSGLADVGRLFGGLSLPPPEPLGDPALEKARLFEAVSRLLTRLANETPVVIFVDDIHRADPATVELLQYLAGGMADQRVLLLVTCSADDLNSSPALCSLITWLQRDGLAKEIFVPRLEPVAVNKLVQSILSGEAPNDLLALLDARAGGVPLFVEALVGSLLDSSSLVRTDGIWKLDIHEAQALPVSIRRLILEGLGRLSPEERRILDFISVMGSATSHVILRAASGLEEEHLLEILQLLRAAGLVIESLDGVDVTYSISHPLIQEVAYAELPEMARRRAHLEAIRALEKFRPDDPNRLARHYRGAGPEAHPNRAIAVLVAAGVRAQAQFAHEEAAGNYLAALAMLREGGSNSSILVEVLERLGEVRAHIGEGQAAIAFWNEALALREQSGNAIAIARLRRELARAEWDTGNFNSARAHLEAGLKALAGHEPCLELVDLQYTRFHIFYRLGDMAGVAEAMADLSVTARLLGSPRAEAEASLVASQFHLGQADVETARQRALHALYIGEQAQDLAVCCRAYIALVVCAILLGDHQFIRFHAERGLPVTQRLGVPHFEVYLRLRLAYADFLSGVWDEWLRNSMDAVALARRVCYPRDLALSLAERAMVLALQGELSEAETCISEVRLAFGSGTPADRGVFGPIDIAETAVALQRGQLERALTIAKGFMNPPASPISAGPPTGLTPPYMPLGLVLLAEAQAATGEATNALDTARAIAALGSSGLPYLDAMSSRAEGLARLAMGNTESAIHCFTRAHEIFADLGMPFEAAKSLLEQAAVMVHCRQEAAAAAAQRSLAIFERIGAQRHAGHARRVLRELGASPAATRRPQLGGVSVSDRELEIARLVAQGLTTSEIAKRLVLSRSTVNAHLYRMYTRLGIGSRASLTRLVLEAGLLSP